MWFPTKKKVVLALSALHVHSKGMEQQVDHLAEQFNEGERIFGPLEELQEFRQELVDTSEALHLASAAVFCEQVSPRVMAKKLPFFREQLLAYQQAISATRQSMQLIKASV